MKTLPTLFQELVTELDYLFDMIDVRAAIEEKARQEPADNSREHEACLLRSYRKAKNIVRRHRNNFPA